MRTSSVSQTGVGASAPIPLDPYNNSFGAGAFVKATGTVTASVEITADDIFDPGVTPVWFPCGVANLTGLTTNQAGSIIIPAKACRINVSAGTGTAALQVVQASVFG